MEKLSQDAPVVLIVDDNLPMLSALASALRHWMPGVAFVEAQTAHAALQAIERHAPRLAVIDVGLPDGDGIELARRITSRGTGLRVVLISMQGDREIEARAIGAGAIAFIAKDRLFSELPRLLAAMGLGTGR